MDMKQAALEVIAEVTGTEISKLAPETELVADLGIDSPRALHLLVKLEDRLEIEVDEEVVEEMKTVGDILRAIEQHDAAAG